MAKKQNPPIAKNPAKSRMASSEEPAAIGLPPIAKQLLLLFVAAAALFSILKLEKHQIWLKKIEGYQKDIADNKREMSLDEKMQQRHGGNYVLPKFIAEKAKPTDVLLLPPKEYVQKYERNPNNWSNPYVFYYMNSKVRTIPFVADSLHKQTTLTVMYNPKGQPSLVPIPNDSTRNAIVKQMSTEAKQFLEEQARKK